LVSNARLAILNDLVNAIENQESREAKKIMKRLIQERIDELKLYYFKN